MPHSPAESATRHAGPLRSRRALLATVALLALVAVALIAATAMDLGFLRPRLERTASEALGQNVRIEGAVGLDLLAGPALTLDAVRVGDGETPLFRAERLRLRPSVVELLQGTVSLAAVHASGAAIHLVRGEEGSWPAAGGGDAAGETPSLPAISLKDTSFRYRDEATGPEIQADGCQLTLPQIRLAAAPDRATLQRLWLDGALECARVQRGALVISGLHANLQADGGQLAATPLRAAIFDGELDGELRADVTGGTPAFELAYRLRGFALEAFLNNLASEAEASGRMDLEVTLEARGHDRAGLTRSLNGRIRLGGESLRVEGVDLDQRLAEYRSTQRFNLVDVGAFLFAGPAGLAVTKGYDYTRLLRGGDGSTQIRQLASVWRITDGIAAVEDVALATGSNRLAALGALDIPEQRFQDFRVLLVDERGCAVMEQAITGTFADPGIAETSMVASLLGPLTSLVERGVEALTPDDCEPVYTGSVSPP
ncbi:AsmA family protein [Spiribacter halobius]|uniref:AsmA domain-containing protein n=1 Tax=Sediminicurvatus halobius TaxID=2182432 RepID=A0A2U2N5L2_9GAMM|nr:AsmA family protein [Spiribacter halobius]PWG64383.1 hypothetical protein DEM34_05750 [Spiribacter halobius]UEX79269.1 AsmA family protein [Spiribacter halobius]